MFYVVYAEKEVIQGPLEEGRAQAICEDLEFLFEDKHYQILCETELAQHHLEACPRYQIHEDMPAI